MPLSAPTLSVVPSRSAPIPPAGEASASAAPVAPFRADLPALAATAPGTTPAMTGLAASEPGLTQLSTNGTQPDQRLPPNAIAETPVPPRAAPRADHGAKRRTFRAQTAWKYIGRNRTRDGYRRPSMDDMGGRRSDR